MNMNVGLLKNFRINPQLLGMRPNHRIGRFDGFLHYVAEFAGLGNFTLARHVHSFDKENVAADFRPGQTGRHADMILFFGFAVAVFDDPEILAQVSGINPDMLVPASGQQYFLNRLAGYCRQFAFQITNAGFAGIIADNVAYRLVGNFQFMRLNGIFLKYLRNQVPLGNFHFFVFGIA